MSKFETISQFMCGKMDHADEIITNLAINYG